MAQTLYASFADVSLAEKATGALLDYGVRAEDISLIAHEGEAGTDTDRRDFAAHTATLERGTASAPVRTYADDDNDAVDAADSGVAGTKSIGNRVAEGTDRLAAGISDAVGADATAEHLRRTADERDTLADTHAARSSAEMREATDMDEGYRTETRRDYETDTTRYESHEEDRKDDDLSAKSGISTTTPGDAAAGAAKGAGIGLGVGALAALASIMVPGFGLVVGGGALATALAGAAATTAAGAVTGGVHGYLKDQGVSDQAAMAYDETFQQGGAVLSVTVPSGDVDQATIEGILHKYGASNVNTYGQMAA